MTPRAVPVAVGALMLALVACSGSDDTGPEADAPASSPTPSTSAPAPPSKPVQFRLVAEANTPSVEVDCAADPVPSVETPRNQQVTACDRVGVAYLLEPAVIVGGVENASARLPEGGDWTVTIALDEAASADLADLTAEIGGTGRQVAIVQDGVVVSAPSVQGTITGGQLEISGNFDQEDAEALAAALLAGG